MNDRRLLLHILTLLLTAGWAKDGIGQWVSTSGPHVSIHTTRAITTIDASATTIFAATANDSLVVSSDNGTSWSWATPPTRDVIRFLGVSNTDILAVTNGNRVFVTTDNGIHWMDASTGLSNTDVLSFATTVGNIFVSTPNGGVFRSTNHGASWTTANKGIPATTVNALAAIGSTLLAGTQYGGGFVSNDNGASWTAVGNTSGLTCIGVNAFAVSGSNVFAGSDDKGTFISTDRGTSWSLANNGMPGAGVFQFTASGTVIFAATKGNGVYRSTDNGANWLPINAGLPTNTEVSRLAVGGGHLFAVTLDKRLFLSTDDGSTWAVANSGYDISQISPVRALLASGTDLFAGTGNVYLKGSGVFRSTDNGDNWIPANHGIENISVSALAEVGTIIFAGTDSGSKGPAFTSSDQGANWTPVNSGFQTSVAINAFAVKGTDLLAATSGPDGRGGLYVTTNLGVQWTSILPDQSSSAILVDGGNIIAAVSSSTLSLSTNNGTTWTPIHAGLPNAQVTALTVLGTELFAGTSNAGIYYSTNYGASWLPVTSGSTGNHVLTLTTIGNNLLAGTTNGIYRSTDNGVSWFPYSTGITSSIYGRSIYAFVSMGGNMFAATDSLVWRRPMGDLAVSRDPANQTSMSLTNNPNPFTEFTNIDVTSSESGTAHIVIVNVLGEEIGRVFDGELLSGEQHFMWDARNFAPGTYWCEVLMNGQVHRSAIVLKR